MRTGSISHPSLRRRQLYGGVPKLAFLIIALGGMLLFVGRLYFYLPVPVLLFWLAKYFTLKDPDWMDILMKYIDEAHSFDSLPRPKYFRKRSKGWGNNLPC